MGNGVVVWPITDFAISRITIMNTKTATIHRNELASRIQHSLENSDNAVSSETWALEVRRDFGAVVRRERARLAISQEVLAERAGLHRTYITDIERGARNISLETMCRLAVALKVPIQTLVASIQQPPGSQMLPLQPQSRSRLPPIVTTKAIQHGNNCLNRTSL